MAKTATAKVVPMRKGLNVADVLKSATKTTAEKKSSAISLTVKDSTKELAQEIRDKMIEAKDIKAILEMKGSGSINPLSKHNFITHEEKAVLSA